jgi:hypothetical protein
MQASGGLICAVLVCLVLWVGTHRRPLESCRIASASFINLEKSVERHANFLKDFGHAIGLTPIRVIATATHGRGTLTAGQTGNYISHMRVLRRVGKKRGTDWHLICEDDATGDFDNLEQYLCGVRQHSCMPNVIAINLFSPKLNVFGAGFGTRTTAYLVTPAGARLLHSELKLSAYTRATDMVLSHSWHIGVKSMAFRGVLAAMTNTSSTISGHK